MCLWVCVLGVGGGVGWGVVGCLLFEDIYYAAVRSLSS